MKASTIFVILGVGFLVLCGVCGIGGYSVFRAGATTEKDAVAYTSPVIERIASTWDVDTFEKNGTEGLRTNAPPDIVKAWFKRFQDHLGHATKFSEPTMLGINSNILNGQAQTTVALQYKTTFEKGKGEINVTVVKANGQWRIHEFRVNAPGLTK